MKNLIAEQAPVQRFGDERGRAQPKGSVDGLDILPTGLDDDGQVPGPGIGADPGQGIETVEDGHFQVEQDDVVIAFVQFTQGLGTVRRNIHRCLGRRQIDLAEFSQDWIVVDEQYPRGLVQDVEKAAHSMSPEATHASFRLITHLSLKA